MAGARHRNWEGGARARLYERSTGDPGDDSLLGYVWHPHLFGEGWLDGSSVTSVQPELSVPVQSSITFTRKGHRCPVRVRCTRTTGFLGSPVPEEHVMSASESTLTLSTGEDESLENFHIRGR